MAVPSFVRKGLGRNRHMGPMARYYETVRVSLLSDACPLCLPHLADVVTVTRWSYGGRVLTLQLFPASIPL